MKKEIKKGIESLMLSVQKDCNENEGCFNPNGCDKESTEMRPETNPNLIKMGITQKCVSIIKCTHKYCDKYKWVLDRAEEYAKALRTTKEEVIKVWEENRGYWYMNYYQGCKQPHIQNGSVYVFDSAKDFWAKVSGEFRCPSCEKISTNPYDCSQDGCNWKSYGLFGTSGKGITVICKDTLQSTHIFKPIIFENKDTENQLDSTGLKL